MTTNTYFQNWFCVKTPAVLTYYYCYFKIKAYYNYTVLMLTLVANSEST